MLSVGDAACHWCHEAVDAQKIVPMCSGPRIVLVERLASGECNEGLAEDVFVSAVDGVGAAAAGRGVGLVELLSCQGGERGFLHGGCLRVMVPRSL